MRKASQKPPPEHESHLYLVFGDEFLVKERVSTLVDTILGPELRATNLIVLDGAHLDASTLSNQVFTPSLFGGPRVIVVDQTALFAGKSNQSTIAGKAIQSWKSGDRKAALRSFVQLMASADLIQNDLEQGSEWTQQLGEAVDSGDKDVLVLIAQAYLEQGQTRSSVSSESILEEIIASRFPEGTVLIFTAPAVDIRKKLYKAVEKHGRVLACAVKEQKYGAAMDRAFFDDRVLSTLGKAGKSIGSAALERMYSRSGKELRKLQSELQKLIAYVGERSEITSKDVEEIFADFHEAFFFDLINAVRNGDAAKSLQMLHDTLRDSSHPLAILGAIASEFRKLIVAREMLFTVLRPYWKSRMNYQAFVKVMQEVRSSQPPRKGKSKLDLPAMKDYPLYLLLKDAEKIPLEKLVAIMEAILEVDIMMKSSRLGSQAPEALLQELILKICEPTGQHQRATGR